MFEKSAIVEKAEKFTYEVENEVYENYAGLKDTINTADIYKKYDGLFSRDNIEAIKQARASKKLDDETARQLMYLQRFAVEGYMDNAIRELNDEIVTKESQAKITVDSKEHPYRYAPILMMNEDDRERRLRIDRSRDPVVKELNVLLKARMEKLYDLTHSLGYRDYISLFMDLKGIDFAAFSRLLDEFLKKTEKTYVDHLEEILETIGLKIDAAERSDVSYLFRAKKYDPYFKKELAVPALKKTLLGMGIDLEKQKNIRLDLEEREKKSPRAFCMPLKTPEEVILVTMPRGGQDDYHALFHECGHAEHFGNTGKKLAFEYKYLGDISVSETYAFLMQYLTTDSSWLAEFVGMKETSDYLKFVFFNKLFMLRRYSAKLKYEIELHRGNLEKGGELYAKNLEAALKIRHPPHYYLSDLDDGFYSSQYLRAWLFEAMLRTTLKEKFGKQWYMKSESGMFLKELWALGEKYTVDELAQRIGWKGLDTKPVVGEIMSALKS